MSIKPIVDRVSSLISRNLIPVLDNLIDIETKEKAVLKKIFDSPISQMEIALNGIVNQMGEYELFAYAVSEKMVNSEDSFNRKMFVRELKSKIGVDVSNLLSKKSSKILLDSTIRDNVQLIKSIPAEYLGKVEKSIRRGLDKGETFFSIKKDILELSDVSYRRARLIARDQVQKLNSGLNEIRQNELGINKYRWRSSGDSNVRPEHARNDGKLFSWSDPPSTGHPGKDVGCRCTADPYIEGLFG